MDMIHTGMFLAQLRREKGLSQEALGEKLGVTNKTVSRWETGKYMPPVEALEQLSGFYGVTINELLAGSRASGEEYREASEKNIRAALRSGAFTWKETLAFYRRKWLREHAAGLTIQLVLLLGACVRLWLNGEWGRLAAVILPVIWYGFHRNRMMIYAEKHAFPLPDEEE